MVCSIVVCRLYLKPGDKVLNSLGGYPAFNYHIDGCGAELLTVPYVDKRRTSTAFLTA